ncbi:MAG: hypothetical protein HY329_04700 [Chloroflexi bacterium]|nr:hypothetical protein [Chloroflexota bacterium]
MLTLGDVLLHGFGTIGLVLLLGAYYLVSVGRIGASSAAYQWLNLVGAIVLMLYGALLSAWASVALNAIWSLIAFRALVRFLRHRRS